MTTYSPTSSTHFPAYERRLELAALAADGAPIDVRDALLSETYEHITALAMKLDALAEAAGDERFAELAERLDLLAPE